MGSGETAMPLPQPAGTMTVASQELLVQLGVVWAAAAHENRSAETRTSGEATFMTDLPDSGCWLFGRCSPSGKRGEPKSATYLAPVTTRRAVNLHVARYGSRTALTGSSAPRRRLASTGGRGPGSPRRGARRAHRPCARSR